MLTNAFMPVRTSLSRAINIESARIISRCPEFDRYRIEVGSISSPNDFENNQVYQIFMPDRLGIGDSTAIHAPGGGVATFPLPEDLPFTQTEVNLQTDCLQIWAFGPRVSDNISRKLWFEVEISLSEKGGCRNIGGICYGGYPYLPYYITAQGENSANFGLPREMRLSWDGVQNMEFLDDENAILKQEPASHGQVHIWATGPIHARTFRLRIADFPRIIKRTYIRNQNYFSQEYWGVTLPYLFFFEYREDTRFRPRVPVGLLAATQISSNTSNQHLFSGYSFLNQAAEVPMTDNYYSTVSPRHYFPLSAASLFNKPRSYSINVGNRFETFEEFFASNPLTRDKQIQLFIEQAEEHNRCLSGVKFEMPDNKVVNALTGFNRAKMSIRVYEIDLPEGVSPLDPNFEPLTNKYSTLIYQRSGIAADSSNLACRFIRPTASKFLVVLIKSETRGKRVIALKKLEAIQSAHVTLVPRKSRTQIVRKLNFRLIGPELGSDYSGLGKQGFTFAIERLVAGEKKDVLFEARSLLDLLQLSGTRIYTNHRYLETTRDVSQENSLSLPDSFEKRSTESLSGGWRRSETGDNVSWSPQSAHLNDDPGAGNSFENYSNSESRTRLEHLGFDATSDNAKIYKALNLIKLVNDSYVETLSISDAAKANLRLRLDDIETMLLDMNPFIEGNGWDDSYWCGIDINRLLPVQGLLNISAPPIVYPIDVVESLINTITNPIGALAGSGNDPMALMTSISGSPALGVLALFNGLGFGVNVGLGIGPINGGFSASTSQLLPTLTRTGTSGSTGTIALSANKTGCSYSQNRNTGYDLSETRTAVLQGQSNRKVTRELLMPGTIRHRRAGVSVHWQERPLDIITGSIPLKVTLPATADKIYRTSDEAIRVRFGNGVADGIRSLYQANPAAVYSECESNESLTMDVWFDIQEELVKDDY